MARHSARVVAIEPNPHNVAILQKNVALNALQNVVVRQAAVGNSQGTIDLLEDSTEGGVSYEHGTDNQATILSELVSLDQIAHEYGFPQLLKIDVEGFEDRALKGATQILQRRPKIAIEVHTEWVSRYGSSVAEVIALLNLEDYRVWILPYTAEEVSAWDGRDFREYPPPKFMLFLMPLVASERPAA
jgi:FkbM family methyltransferase